MYDDSWCQSEVWGGMCAARSRRLFHTSWLSLAVFVPYAKALSLPELPEAQFMCLSGQICKMITSECS